ncbi:MAG TPA: MlaD family protein [Puia sp.]|jgi:phospholipid/cholesterol/gamma-HCH transport system substrate-binding protein|uniref:MlaD family protein n=1 Tax=Puia sp. TaxID=2045100 RepID=UPI002BBF437A|nr:MlaD family protein [Puia sp.]HVU94167.1 MlaD family protein [Puia sp.]
MTMRENTRHLLLGIFVAVGAGLFILAVLTVGSRQQSFARTVRIRVLFDDAQGLQPGNNVWLSGVKIGTVKRVSLDENNRVEVLLSIGRDPFSHIYRDTRGKIGTDGFIGNRIVILYGGTKTTGRVAEMAVLTGEQTVRTEDMLATLQANNKNLLVITGELKVIAQKINTGRGTLGVLLNDERMAGQLRRTVGGLHSAAERAEELTEKLDVFAGSLNDSAGLVHRAFTDTLVFQQLQETLEGLRTASGRVAEAAADIRQGTEGLKSDRTPAGVLLHSEEVADDLRVTMEHLRTSSQKLDEDLEALQHNFLLRGFFRKREKARKDSMAKSAGRLR